MTILWTVHLATALTTCCDCCDDYTDVTTAVLTWHSTKAGHGHSMGSRPVGRVGACTAAEPLTRMLDRSAKLTIPCISQNSGSVSGAAGSCSTQYSGTSSTHGHGIRRQHMVTVVSTRAFQALRADHVRARNAVTMCL